MLDVFETHGLVNLLTLLRHVCDSLDPVIQVTFVNSVPVLDAVGLRDVHHDEHHALVAGFVQVAVARVRLRIYLPSVQLDGLDDLVGGRNVFAHGQVAVSTQLLLHRFAHLDFFLETQVFAAFVAHALFEVCEHADLIRIALIDFACLLQSQHIFILLALAHDKCQLLRFYFLDVKLFSVIRNCVDSVAFRQCFKVVACIANVLSNALLCGFFNFQDALE